MTKFLFGGFTKFLIWDRKTTAVIKINIYTYSQNSIGQKKKILASYQSNSLANLRLRISFVSRRNENKLCNFFVCTH